MSDSDRNDIILHLSVSETLSSRMNKVSVD